METKYNSKIKKARLLILLLAIGGILVVITKLINQEKEIVNFGISFLGIVGGIIGLLIGSLFSIAFKNKSSKTKIFLSYSLSDKILADKIAGDLTEKGISIMKESEIKPGENIRDITENYIKNCDSVYVILSSNTYKSKYLKEEVLFAKRKKIPIIPIVTDESEMPTFLTNYKIADFRNSYDDAIKDLIPAK